MNLDYELYANIEGSAYFLGTSRTVQEHLLCITDRLPALSNLMTRATNRSQKSFKVPRQREIFGVLAIIESVFLPAQKALSTLLGGPWIWRYHAVLLELAEAQVYGDKAMKKAANNWLTDVSRIQAHLGVLRLWKSGLWAGISGIAIGFFG